MPNYVASKEELHVSPPTGAEDKIEELRTCPVALAQTPEDPGVAIVYAVRSSDCSNAGVAFRTAVVNCIIAWYYDYSSDWDDLRDSSGKWRLFCNGHDWGPVIDRRLLAKQSLTSVLYRMQKLINDALYRHDMDQAFYKVDKKRHM